MAALCRGDHDGALQLFVAASQKDPTFGEAYNKAGGIHALRNDHLACVTFSALTLQRNPRHFAALAGQGLALAAIAGIFVYLLVDRLSSPATIPCIGHDQQRMSMFMRYECIIVYVLVFVLQTLQRMVTRKMLLRL